MSSCCWMRIKKYLFLHGNRNKKLCWSVICLVNCCFWKEISQLKIFLLTNILTQRLKHLLMIFFFSFFFFFSEKQAPANFGKIHHGRRRNSPFSTTKIKPWTVSSLLWSLITYVKGTVFLTFVIIKSSSDKFRT